MTYSVKEIFYTLQGEGAQTGRPAVFCRFAGCNLWSGVEYDRAKSICTFCDTDFVGTNGPGGGKFQTADDLVAAVADLWPAGLGGTPLVVCTGGEPLLQLDRRLVDVFHRKGFNVAVETNGTLVVPENIDWICVSPKADAALVQVTGNELKLVYPQEMAKPERFAHLGFAHFFLQPMDGPELEANTAAAAHYCMEHPQWRLSLQTHKLIGLP